MTRSQQLCDAYEGLLSILAPDGQSISDDIGWLPTRCAGWSVRDLVFHLLCDAQRALVALGTPADWPADTDSVDYWRSWQPGRPGADAGRRSTRAMASAWTHAASLVESYAETARAVLRQVERADGAALVRTQGRVLTVEDLCATLAVEASVHHLDMLVAWPAPGPSPAAFALVRETLDGLLGRHAPPDWTDVQYVLVGTGRERLTDAERREVGSAAERFPLFG
jgi:hypothetical protein